MTSKQRAKLRAMANGMEPIIFIGKEGITENLLRQAEDALTARELVKGSVQRNCELSAKEALHLLAEQLGAEPVQFIGRKFALYRRNEKKPVIAI